MGEVKNLSDFREHLKPLLVEHDFIKSLSPLEFQMLEVRICQLALDFADGFYREAAGLRAGKVKL